eukprot:scaffold288635_cov60-Attheya_sp.AAC.1
MRQIGHRVPVVVARACVSTWRMHTTQKRCPQCKVRAFSASTQMGHLIAISTCHSSMAVRCSIMAAFAVMFFIHATMSNGISTPLDVSVRTPPTKGNLVDVAKFEIGSNKHPMTQHLFQLMFHHGLFQPLPGGLFHRMHLRLLTLIRHRCCC